MNPRSDTGLAEKLEKGPGVPSSNPDIRALLLLFIHLQYLSYHVIFQFSMFNCMCNLVIIYVLAFCFLLMSGGACGIPSQVSNHYETN